VRDPGRVLEMRGSCERCSQELPADAEAMICVYECTFCPACTEAMAGVCPNCSGELVRRPRAGAVIATPWAWDPLPASPG
jgi:hypothetical protein